MMTFLSVTFCGIYLVMLLTLFLIQNRIYKTFKNPLSFFSILWCVVGFFSNTRILDYDPPSMLVNVAIIGGIIIFTVVYLGLTPYKRDRSVAREPWVYSGNEIIRYRTIILVNLVCWAIMIPRLKNSLSIISSYGYAFLRANLANVEMGISRGGLQDIIFSYMVEPVFITTSILSSFLILSSEGKKKKMLLFLFSTTSIVLYALTSAGRGIIVKFGFCLFFVFMVCARKTIKSLWKNMTIRIITIILTAIVIYITFQRGTWGQDESMAQGIARTFYVYYFSGPGYMTKLIEAQPQYGPGGMLTYGSTTFGCITNWISWLLIFFTGKSQGTLYLLGSVISNTYYNVAPTVKINAMYTCFYAFLLDWGYIGLIIGPILLACFSAYLFKRTYKTGSYRFSVIYVFWLYILFRTVFKLDTIGVGIIIAFVCMKFFVTKKNVDVR